jgi:hypothetical protein
MRNTPRTPPPAPPGRPLPVPRPPVRSQSLPRFSRLRHIPRSDHFARCRQCLLRAEAHRPRYPRADRQSPAGRLAYAVRCGSAGDVYDKYGPLATITIGFNTSDAIRSWQCDNPSPPLFLSLKRVVGSAGAMLPNANTGSRRRFACAPW